VTDVSSQLRKSIFFFFGATVNSPRPAQYESLTFEGRLTIPARFSGLTSIREKRTLAVNGKIRVRTWRPRRQ
jgi:hypothetical protein